MGKQSSDFTFTGRVGKLTFYKTRDNEFFVRSSKGIDRQRLATEENFKRQRYNNIEFRNAAEASKLLRKAMKDFIGLYADSRVSTRLTSEMLKVLKKDPVNKHGERIVAKGPLTMLKDFEFNRHRALESSFKSTFSCSIDRPNGLAAVDIPAYTKATAIESPQGSTHYRLLMAAVDCDFSAGTSFVETSLSGLIPLDDTPADPLTLDCHVPVAGNHPIFLVLGIEYFVELNGVTERLKTESFNALQIVEVGIV